MWADGESTSAMTWVMVAGMAVTSLSALAASVLTYLSGRDKLLFDQKTASLEGAVKECEQDRDVQRNKLDNLTERSDKAEKLTARMEGEHASSERSVKELREEVKELRDRLYGGVKQ